MLTYTRYLYSLEDVKLSYVISLLNKDLRQCYFWIYEMYYSGFQNECFQVRQGCRRHRDDHHGHDRTGQFHE